ncbi:conserved unknown protein [Ectocarpus siliculosus]|uniref:RNA methyltransferase n=1 Tax=Ectocarpus siliculosus TaxID=2880 RepID=D7FLW6_ECTSI|nr:conserved unknown protein [Ectocarpus siliculosus]|eukprot:CBJ29762.1 conserved unknown protein [Ectocarpus siliculosus]
MAISETAAGADDRPTTTAGVRPERTKKRKRFPHGNYTGYYNTRYGIDGSGASAAGGSSATAAAPPPAGARDPRVGLMRRSWFEGKKCLDVGCNEGHLTLALVRTFRPRRMVGLDIDSYLVRRARKELSMEINAAAHAGKSTEFRPLMPRSLRGGEDDVGDEEQATPATASIPVARPDEEAHGADSSTPKLKANAGGEGDASGVSGGARSTEPEVHVPGRKNECRDSRKGSVGAASESVALPESRGGGTTGGAAAGSTSVGTEIDPVRKDRDTRKPVATVGGSLSDTHEGGNDATADDTTSGSTVAEAATVVAVAAAGVVADAAADPDARVLSGCTVSFRCEDFVAEAHGDHGYDVVCLFSVVKWMHINGGDEALRGVFRKTYSLLRPGGRLILEPQPWKTYRKSARQHGLPEAAVIVGTIKLRPQDFPAYLTGEVGFRSWEEVGLPAEGVGGFAKRSVHVFVK